MSYRKLKVLLAIKEPLTAVQQKAWDNALIALKALKPYASKLNEENTTVVSWHVCYHDEVGNTTKCVEQAI